MKQIVCKIQLKEEINQDDQTNINNSERERYVRRCGKIIMKKT